MYDNWHYHFMIDEAQIASLANHSHDMRDCGEGIYRCVYCTMELALIEGSKGQITHTKGQKAAPKGKDPEG